VRSWYAFGPRAASARLHTSSEEGGTRKIPPLLTLPHRRDRNDRVAFEDLAARWLALLFVLYGLIATAFLAINIPPFQNPDEPAHFLRAAQIADGRLIGVRFSTTDPKGMTYVTAGDRVDPALLTVFEPSITMATHLDTRATRTSFAPGIGWSENRVSASFPNTAIYPPFFYMPSAIGVLSGRLARLTVVHTLLVSRLLTGVTAVAIGATAIASAGSAAVWIFAILTLPMSLSLIASSSQDALLLACSALAGVLWIGILRSPSERNGKALAGLALTLGLIAMARPPYVALAILPLGLINLRLRSRLWAAASVMALATAWSGIAAAMTLTNTGALLGADPLAQLTQLSGDPLLILSIAWATLKQYGHAYFEEFIGVLGWLDTGLPGAYYKVAGAMIGVAAIAATSRQAGERTSIQSQVALAVGLLLSAGGVFAIQYLTWTEPGHAVVEGVQGRYFLPLALAGTGLLPMLGWSTRPRISSILVVLVGLFPLATLTIVMRTVILRYYLQ
jgi:uncharacterized membrane protein